MKPAARVAAFVTLLAVIFGAAALAGAALDPHSGGDGASSHGGMAGAHSGMMGGAGAHGGAAAHAGAHGGMTAASGAHGGTPANAGAPGGMTAGADAASGMPATDGGHAGMTADAAPSGFASSQDGYRLVADRTRFVAGRAAALRFRVLDARGATVRAFDTEQAKRMHLIVVRRDLRGYQHLHPTQGSDGAWTMQITLPHAGVYRAFTDFRTGGAQHVLGVDLFVPGRFAPRDLPPAERTAHVDGYDVTVTQRGPDVLTFSVRRRGQAVADLQSYLGARGHLVMLRDGDLAYEHVHPLDEPGLAFHTGTMQPGTYRLFLQFRHRDRVHTAAFTRTVT
jgi:hypothetical protein